VISLERPREQFSTGKYYEGKLQMQWSKKRKCYQCANKTVGGADEMANNDQCQQPLTRYLGATKRHV
jgi:hypothetical protein